MYNRLQAAQRPTPEQLGDYFCKGLRKELRGSVAGRDIQNQADFMDMVNTALRAERRVGKGKKKQKEDDSDSEEEDDSDSDEEDSDSDSDDADSEDSDDEEWTEKKKKKKKKNKKKDKKKEEKKKETKKKSMTKGKKPSMEEEIDKRLAKKLKILGAPQMGESSSSRLVCDICSKIGHVAANCWYNPQYRGRVPLHVMQTNQNPTPQANQVGVEQRRGPSPPRRNQNAFQGQCHSGGLSKDPTI